MSCVESNNATNHFIVTSIGQKSHKIHIPVNVLKRRSWKEETDYTIQGGNTERLTEKNRVTFYDLVMLLQSSIDRLSNKV